MKRQVTAIEHLTAAMEWVQRTIATVASAAAKDISALDSKKADKSHTHTAADVGALPTAGGTLTGNLTGKYITGTWLQTTAAGHLTAAAAKIPVLDSAGWIYYRTAEELLGDLGGAKKPLTGSFTIPASGWGTDSTTGYTKYYDIAVSGVTANDRAEVIIAPGSVNAAAACGMCPISETLAGKVRIRATKVPTAAIAAEYWIEKE